MIVAVLELSVEEGHDMRVQVGRTQLLLVLQLALLQLLDCPSRRCTIVVHLQDRYQCLLTETWWHQGSSTLLRRLEVSRGRHGLQSTSHCWHRLFAIN